MTFETDRNKIFGKLMRSCGCHTPQNDIPFIETLVGKFDGKNVLEGFCANTEALCNVEETSDIFDNDFYKMSTYVIFDIAQNESVKIAHSVQKIKGEQSPQSV